jgi:hypothetical protein
MKTALKRMMVIAGAALLCAALLLPGCDHSPEPPEEPGIDPRLIGSWHSNYQGASGEYEGYVISATTLVYNDGSGGEWGFSYTGTIRYAARFDVPDNNCGIIIVEYTTDGWPTYIEKTQDGRHPIPGPFFGVYYDYLNDEGNFVLMANATTLKPVPPQVLYDPPETKTLEEAIAKFSLENKDKFVADVAIPQFKEE